LTLLPQPLTIQQARLKNPLSLAFVGDTIWDLLTRQQLLETQLKAGALHKQAIQRVNAGAQAGSAVVSAVETVGENTVNRVSAAESDGGQTEGDT